MTPHSCHHSHTHVPYRDLGTNFLVDKSGLGDNRAKVVTSLLQVRPARLTVMHDDLPLGTIRASNTIFSVFSQYHQ